MAQLRGVSENEAWLSFGAPLDTPPAAGHSVPTPVLLEYDAVLDLTSGCVSETYPEWFPSDPEPPTRTDDDEILHPQFQKQLGRYLGFLDRFAIHHVLGMPRRERAYGVFAFTSDRKHIAVSQSHGLYLSRDGGASFARLSGPAGHSLAFAADDRFLVSWVAAPEQPGISSELLIYAVAEPGSPPRTVPVPNQYYLVGVDGSSLIFSHYGKAPTERCVSSLDVTNGALTQRYCVTGPPRLPSTFFLLILSPNNAFGEYQTGDFDQTRLHIMDAHTGAELRTLSKHVFGMSFGELADDGRYFWQASSDGKIRGAGPRGERLLQTSGDFLGLDLAGRVLTFHKPPLQRPHLPGKLMPPTVGALGDYRCSLLHAVNAPN